MPTVEREVALGREVDLQLRESLSVYDERPELTRLVNDVGAKVAAQTERPDLPWRFTIVDDPDPGAFSVAGGSVYVTRGLLAYLNSTDELAAVLGHECGHVAARHGVKSLDRLARRQHRRGFSTFEGHVSAVVGGKRSVERVLERSRDDELLADELSLEYIESAGYEPRGMVTLLDALGGLQGGFGAEVASTHPTTTLRRAKLVEVLGDVGSDRAYDAEYLEALDGVRFGVDPRQGYAVDNRVVHPELGYAVTKPADWSVEFGNGMVAMTNAQTDLLLVIDESKAESMKAGMNELLGESSEWWRGQIGRKDAAVAKFETVYEGVPIYGLFGLIDFDGRLVQILTFSPKKDWAEAEVRKMLETFRGVSKQEVNVEPMRLDVVEVAETTTLKQYYAEASVSVPLSVVERLNGLESEADVAAGRRVKHVVGFNPDFSRPGTTTAKPNGAPEKVIYDPFASAAGKRDDLSERQRNNGW